ncbi:MAG: hypothetical protein WCC53_08240 [Thermoanaerobaculia bacterium]
MSAASATAAASPAAAFRETPERRDDSKDDERLARLETEADDLRALLHEIRLELDSPSVERDLARAEAFAAAVYELAFRASVRLRAVSS